LLEGWPGGQLFYVSTYSTMLEFFQKFLTLASDREKKQSENYKIKINFFLLLLR